MFAHDFLSPWMLANAAVRMASRKKRYDVHVQDVILVLSYLSCGCCLRLFCLVRSQSQGVAKLVGWGAAPVASHCDTF